MILFEKSGKENTEKVLKAVMDKCTNQGIKKIVIPSVSGYTVSKALEILSGIEIIVVTHVTGFSEEGVAEFPEELRKFYEERGVKFVTAAHSFGTIGRAARRKLGTYQIDEIAANVLRIFGQGTKVAAEVAMMSCDRGYISPKETIIACGGTEEGIDTAVVLRPVNTHNFFDMKIREIICKPE